MSDYFIRFIPESISSTLTQDEMKLIEGLGWGENTPKFIFNERIQFADAGQNFESVKCPSCKNDLMEWWGNAMSSAYSEENGFLGLEIITPCCSTITSLHELEYSFSQGFYKTMIEIVPESEIQIMSEEIADRLFKITRKKWREIHAHY